MTLTVTVHTAQAARARGDGAVTVEAVTLDQLAHDPRRALTLSCEIRLQMLMQVAGVLAALSAAGSADTQMVSPPESEEYLTLGELAERTGYGKSTIRAWVANGFLKKGEHYIGEAKKRRYLMRAIVSHLSQNGASDASPVVVPATPFARKGRRHG